MARSSFLLRSASVVALIAFGLTGCATSDRAHDDRRHGSIKDDPVDVPTAAATGRRGPVAVKVAAPAARIQPTPVVVSEPVAPTPRLPSADPQPRPSVVRVEQPPPRVERAAPSTPAASPAVPMVSELKIAAVVEQPPKVQPKAPESVPVVAPSHSAPPASPVTVAPAAAPSPSQRATTDLRRPDAVDSAAPPAPMPLPSALSAPKNTATPPAAPSPSGPAPVATPSVPPKATPPAEPSKVAAAAAPPVEPKIVPLSDEQRIEALLQRADTYMKANRYQEARTVLEDAAKAGHPRLLAALAELYDPLILRETYPRLVRTGDPDKAIALYEQARNAGGRGLEPKLAALKALAGPKR